MLQRCRDPIRRAKLERELAGAPCPPELAYLWLVYWRLRKRKALGESIAPIEWPDIDAFVRQSRFVLAPWEIEAIEDLDDLFRSQRGGASKSEQQTESPDG